jgi:hypothetical protein
MTTNPSFIEAKKAGIAERFRAVGEGSVRFIATREEVLEFIDGELESFLSEIEGRIIPKCIDHNCDNEGTVAERDGEGDWIPAPCQYCHQVRFPMREAFQHLRTGVTE